MPAFGFRQCQVAVLLLISAGIARGQNTPATQPTITDVQTAIDARQYQSAIKLASKLLALRGPAAAGLSRFQVTMLKGDAQAGGKAISTAVTTYKSAAKETQDPAEQALSQWTAELFHTAGSTIYTPKMLAFTKKRGPFDLMKMDQRKLAFATLLEDDLSALEPKLKAATVSQSLVQIWPVLQQVSELAELDQIANGNDDKTTGIASGLMDHSRNLCNNQLKEYWARLGDIDTSANATTRSQTQQAINGTYVSQTIIRKNGLTDANKSELNDMIAVSRKIHDAAQTFMTLSKNDTGWTTILGDANRVAARAGDVLGADYTTPVSQTNTSTYNNTGYGNTSPVGGTTTVVQPTTRPVKKTVKPNADAGN